MLLYYYLNGKHGQQAARPFAAMGNPYRESVLVEKTKVQLLRPIPRRALSIRNNGTADVLVTIRILICYRSLGGGGETLALRHHLLPQAFFGEVVDSI
jgi:hypothetical protein